jgi:DNA-binding NarL/FixJ family response regulator/DNA-binding CsgD family transcriptional regulator
MDSVSLFIVEDELLVAHDLELKLSELGCRVLGTAPKGEVALEMIDKFAGSNDGPDIVLMDVGLAGEIDGIETAKQLSDKHKCGIIFLTGLDKNEVFSKSFSLKPYAYIFKPVDIDQIKIAISLADYQRKLELSNERMIVELKHEIGRREKIEKEMEVRHQETLKCEQKINQLLKQKHQMEIDLINRELATSSIFISQKNKIINLVRKEINRMMKQGKIVTKTEISRVLKSIDENVKFENDWYRIKAHFEKIHPEFFDRLRQNYPGLTPNDHKLAALLRMNLSTKEISQILKITAPSTEISRIRLRKKLGLPKSANLVQFICNL